jgi:hypothetical protein
MQTFAFGGVSCRSSATVAVFLIAIGAASVALFVAGFLPLYGYEHGGYVNAAERCPEKVVSEQGYDGACVDALLARGPVYLGKEAFAGSFLLGAACLGGIYRARRSALVRIAAVSLLLFWFPLGWALVFWPPDMPGIAQSGYVFALVAILVAFVLPGRFGRPGTILLSIVYAVAWIAFLSWNAVEAADPYPVIS